MQIAKCALFFLLSSVSRVVAPPPLVDICYEASTLLASDGVAADWFGASVDVSATTLAVAATGKNIHDGHTGAVYLHVPGVLPGTWQFHQMIYQSDSDPYFGTFGFSVAISENTLVVGASSAAAGAAYVYSPDATGFFVQRAEMVAPADALFYGSSVAIDGTVAVVGAIGNTLAFVYTSDQADWVNGVSDSYNATSSDGQSWGYSVAVSGNRILAGNPYNNSVTGAIYLFALTAPGPIRRLTDAGPLVLNEVSAFSAPDGQPGDAFGFAVDLIWPFAVVGAPNRNNGDGSTFILLGDSIDRFQQIDEFPSPSGQSATGFGHAVAFINASSFAVSAPQDYSATGSVSVYNLNFATFRGDYVATFMPDTNVFVESMGFSLGATSTGIVSGTSGPHDDSGVRAAYYFELPCTHPPSTKAPTLPPAKPPTKPPTKVPTRSPTKPPTKPPTKVPTRSPTKSPTKAPTKSPTKKPTKAPTKSPTKKPTKAPTKSPTRKPTKAPTKSPTKKPTKVPTKPPANAPTKKPCNGNGIGSAVSPHRCA